MTSFTAAELTAVFNWALVEVLEEADPPTVDVGHVLGDARPERRLSFTVTESGDVTLWDEDAEGGATELGIFTFALKVIG